MLERFSPAQGIHSQHWYHYIVVSLYYDGVTTLFGIVSYIFKACCSLSITTNFRFRSRGFRFSSQDFAILCRALYFYHLQVV